MTTVFHAGAQSWFIEIESNLRRKKLHGMNQGFNFHGGNFSNRDNVRAQSNLEEKVSPRILKDEFSVRADPFILTSIAPMLLDWSNKTSWVFPALKSTSQYLKWKFCLWWSIDHYNIDPGNQATNCDGQKIAFFPLTKMNYNCGMWNSDD